MRTIELVVVAILGATLAAAPGCHATRSADHPRGSTLSPEAPPAPLDPYFENKPDQIWVHARWAWIDHQWMWQPGHHEPARANEVFVCGRWERRKNAYEWIEGGWQPARAEHAFAPGHWDYRGTQFVWILDSWEPKQSGMVWVEGRWIEGAEGKVFIDGHWAEPPPPPRVARDAARAHRRGDAR